MTYPIYVYGTPILRKVAEDIDKDYPELDKFIADMFDTMYKADGLGLAAPQVGKSIRLIVIDGEPLAKEHPEMKDFKRVLINAHVLEKGGEKVPMGEGCLSLPGIHEEVERESEVKMEYYDENWEFHTEIFKGYKARVVLHEYDHLDGILFPDRLSPLRRRLIKGKLTDISKGKFDAEYRTILPISKR
ncbi:MAG TPA: peptide deformylase [Bacteroidales bacterium]|nr:peptide deformylase [Bacteroidales bacterium]HPT11480.1 peptide deformylase [Bacteroidales bacterium]